MTLLKYRVQQNNLPGFNLLQKQPNIFFMTNSFLATCSMIQEVFENYVRQAVTFIVNALPQGHFEALSYFL